ncbi:Jag N-terminal domain-containing protein [Nitratifractor sp.]
MKKFEATTLEETYRLACDELGCSMRELRYEIVQYPSKGILGFFAKPAVIVAMRETPRSGGRSEKDYEAAAVEKSEPKEEARERPVERDEAESEEMTPRPEEKISNTAPESHEAIIENFFDEGSADTERHGDDGTVDEQALQKEIEDRIKELMEVSCFDIDTVEVDVVEKTAYIFLDGEDAALIIGKEGYRYNALSYLLFNWLHSRYDLYIKLEVAQFLTTQEEMIRHKIQPVIEHVHREGWGRTRPLDGILVQIALEQLREAFPDKYVGIKRQRDGSRYVLINEFNARRQ